MINSKQDYKYYLKCDAFSSGRKTYRTKIVADDVWKFQKTMRLLEYYTNCKKHTIYKPIKLILKYRLYHQSLKTGLEIPINVCGPGLSIAHRGPIVINGHTKIGANCRIHMGVNIGTSAGIKESTPIIGDNCYIGPGAKLFGKITLGNNVAIGANSVVNKTFAEDNITIAGVPAKIINRKGSEGFIRKAAK